MDAGIPTDEKVLTFKDYENRILKPMIESMIGKEDVTIKAYRVHNLEIYLENLKTNVFDTAVERSDNFIKICETRRELVLARRELEAAINA